MSDQPSFFILGDSISIDYGPFLQGAMCERATIHRKDGLAEAQLNLDNPVGANGGTSTQVKRYLKAWADDASSIRHHVLLLNCGLHDIKTSKKTGDIVTMPDQYRANLLEIISITPNIADYFAWIRTTPVDDIKHAGRMKFGFDRFQRDVDSYNTIADEVMSAAKVPIIDLHSFTLSRGDSIFRDGVHFSKDVITQQGVWIAGWLTHHLFS